MKIIVLQLHQVQVQVQLQFSEKNQKILLRCSYDDCDASGDLKMSCD
jgi:hypothetical protein